MKFTNIKKLIITFFGGGKIKFPFFNLRNVIIDGDSEGGNNDKVGPFTVTEKINPDIIKQSSDIYLFYCNDDGKVFVSDMGTDEKKLFIEYDSSSYMQNTSINPVVFVQHSDIIIGGDYNGVYVCKGVNYTPAVSGDKTIVDFFILYGYGNNEKANIQNFLRDIETFNLPLSYIKLSS